MSPSCRRNGQRVSAAAATSRTAASAAASSFTACGPRLESTYSCARKLFLPQPTFQPLTSPFIPYAVPLAHGRCVCVASRRRALHASGAPPWRRPASAAALVAAWASTAALPALFARCFGRIGVELERAHAHASRCSLTSRYEILNSHSLLTFCSRLAGSFQHRGQVRHRRGRRLVVLLCLLLPGLLHHPDRQPGAPSPPYTFSSPPPSSLSHAPLHFLGPIYPSPP